MSFNANFWPSWNSWKRFGLALILLIAALTVGGVVARLLERAPLAMADGAPRPAPDFTLLTPDGTPVRLSDWRGHPVLINFWASWCGPCEVEMPAIQAAYDLHREKGLVVLAVAVEDEPENVTRFFERYQLTFQPLMDDGTAAQQYRVFGLPTSVFVNAQGQIVATHTGVLSAKLLADRLAQILPAGPE